MYMDQTGKYLYVSEVVTTTSNVTLQKQISGEMIHVYNILTDHITDRKLKIAMRLGKNTKKLSTTS